MRPPADLHDLLVLIGLLLLSGGLGLLAFAVGGTVLLGLGAALAVAGTVLLYLMLPPPGGGAGPGRERRS